MIIEPIEFIPLELAKELKPFWHPKESLFYYFPNEQMEYTLMYGGSYIGRDTSTLQTRAINGDFRLTIPAPTFQLVFDWINDNYGYESWITTVINRGKNWQFDIANGKLNQDMMQKKRVYKN